MKHLAVIFVVLLMFGCTPQRESVSPPEALEIVSMVPMPPITMDAYTSDMKLDVLFRVMEDGSVSEVRIINLTFDHDWNAAAIDSLKRWRFNALPPDRQPDGIVVRRTVQLEIRDPVELIVGEIITDNKQDVDVYYELLKNGTDFLTLLQQSRDVNTQGDGLFPRKISLAYYPEHVRIELENLRVNEFTKPIRVGKNFVIYKRFDSINS